MINVIVVYKLHDVHDIGVINVLFTGKFRLLVFTFRVKFSVDIKYLVAAYKHRLYNNIINIIIMNTPTMVTLSCL